MYDRFPYVGVSTSSAGCTAGWSGIIDKIRSVVRDAALVCIECYPGVFTEDIVLAVRSMLPRARIIESRHALKSPAEIDTLVSRDLSDDPVFGRLTGLDMRDFFGRLNPTPPSSELTFVIGTGALLLCENPDLLVYADLARWEIQRRQRTGEIGNLAADNERASPAEKYKRGFFLDWRVADRFKGQLFDRIDFLLDTNDRSRPKLITGESLRRGLQLCSTVPFRVVPFFDPGPWGGQWMRKVCGLPDGAPNFAWCFDCVPEENSLLLGFGNERIEIPASNLIARHPRALLGEAVHARFGAEFPIRFDFLDTMGGGNLSLQVHPLTEYIQTHFGMHYTQDESYYLLDAEDDACVYLGLREGIDRNAMLEELYRAQAGELTFDASRYVNIWPAKKHDHFLIPAGTIHCSGRNSMVLEISATPYIFTFKLWDWGRLGLDGRPRPIHLGHGARNIQWDRTQPVIERDYINRFESVAEGEGWREERTGLHEREFIETRRHWFTDVVPHDTAGGVNVLNLVEGEAALVESPTGAFPDMTVHYAETFIVPAAVGPYTIRPAAPATKPFATIKASVRTGFQSRLMASG